MRRHAHKWVCDGLEMSVAYYWWWVEVAEVMLNPERSLWLDWSTAPLHFQLEKFNRLPSHTACDLRVCFASWVRKKQSAMRGRRRWEPLGSSETEPEPSIAGLPAKIMFHLTGNTFLLENMSTKKNSYLSFSHKSKQCQSVCLHWLSK